MFVKKFLGFGVVTGLVFPLLVRAQNVVGDCLYMVIPVPCVTNLAGPAGELTASGLVLSVISIALWIVGLLAVLFVIVGGFRYITAHGNEEQAEAAKKTIIHAITGILIVILSFVIIRILANALLNRIV